MAKKIYIDRSDTLAGAIEKVLAVEDKEIILYIPRSAKISASANNFRHLKRELDSAGYKVEIESVDDKVLETTKMIGFKSVNPFFKKGQKQISDIIHPGGVVANNKRRVEEEETSIVDDPEPVKIRSKPHRESRRVISNRHKIIAIIIAAAVLIGVISAAVFLPEAKILVSMQSIERDFSGSLVTGATVKSAEFANNTVRIPGLFVEKTKNITRVYPATGTQSLNVKATGTVTISNVYSSSPQGLVVGTRLQSPDGKIFKLTKSITVPGAKTVNGKLVASTIKAQVQADVAGPEYNIAPSHFTIPGFKGTAKYTGFYGDSDSAMTGGISGTAKVATESDIAKAKEDIHGTLENALRSEIILSIPSEIKIIDAATRFTVTKEDINKVADANGNFTIVSYGSVQFVGFKEADIRAVLEPHMISTIKLELAESDIKIGADNSMLDVILKESSITYGEPRVDFAKKDMSISLKFHSSLRRELDITSFSRFVSGKRAGDLSGDQVPFPGIESIKVKLWPFWVSAVPKSQSKVTIDVE